MDVSAQSVDADVLAMPDDEHQNEHDHADNAAAHHAADLVEDRRDNAGRKSQRQQTAVRQDIAEIARDPVQSVRALRKTDDRILAASAGEEQNDDSADSRHDTADCHIDGRQDESRDIPHHVHRQQR